MKKSMPIVFSLFLFASFTASTWGMMPALDPCSPQKNARLACCQTLKAFKGKNREHVQFSFPEDLKPRLLIVEEMYGSLRRTLNPEECRETRITLLHGLLQNWILTHKVYSAGISLCDTCKDQVLDLQVSTEDTALRSEKLVYLMATYGACVANPDSTIAFPKKRNILSCAAQSLLAYLAAQHAITGTINQALFSKVNALLQELHTVLSLSTDVESMGDNETKEKIIWFYTNLERFTTHFQTILSALPTA